MRDLSELGLGTTPKGAVRKGPMRVRSWETSKGPEYRLSLSSLVI